MPLEDIVKTLALSTQQFQQETRSSIQNLESQISQLASSVSRLESQGKLPSQTIINPKQNASAIVLRSGKELSSESGTMRGHARQEKSEIELEIPSKQAEKPDQVDNDTSKEKNETLPVIISSKLSTLEEEKLIRVLREFREAIGWTIADIKGLSPSTCMHRILLEEGAKPSREAQRRLNPPMMEVVKKEILKLLDAGMIFPIFDSEWVSPTQVVPKKTGITVIENSLENLIPTRVQNGWRVCIDYRKLNASTRKDHFPLPFIDQMLERLAGRSHYCCLDGYSVFIKPVAPPIKKRQLLHAPLAHSLTEDAFWFMQCTRHIPKMY
ncbi:UNVERIFIED_CONTAM: hypothetical protein Sradi_3001400, partial [Sesamum radiatum]